ncbi:hypothetical protein IPA_01190 [Ignicoccus pacificus DSM 13166]|uniref:Uncharacterized protein n=1 Tax=Ignicoccus pacificus DSM 13166 TaxID=940294 RepID=A0A977PKI5_9CREN|nr:hypothetical protein IPA_01190 [Ignicoccus pacificus DSM 13166]
MRLALLGTFSINSINAIALSDDGRYIGVAADDGAYVLNLDGDIVAKYYSYNTISDVSYCCGKFSFVAYDYVYVYDLVSKKWEKIKIDPDYGKYIVATNNGFVVGKDGVAFYKWDGTQMWSTNYDLLSKPVIYDNYILIPEDYSYYDYYLRVVKLSDGGTIASPLDFGYSFKMAICGNYLAVLEYYKLILYNITDVKNPRELWYDTGFSDASSVAFTDHCEYVLVSDGDDVYFYNVTNGKKVYNMTISGLKRVSWKQSIMVADLGNELSIYYPLPEIELTDKTQTLTWTAIQSNTLYSFTGTCFAYGMAATIIGFGNTITFSGYKTIIVSNGNSYTYSSITTITQGGSVTTTIDVGKVVLGKTITKNLTVVLSFSPATALNFVPKIVCTNVTATSYSGSLSSLNTVITETLTISFPHYTSSTVTYYVTTTTEIGGVILPTTVTASSVTYFSTISTTTTTILITKPTTSFSIIQTLGNGIISTILLSAYPVNFMMIKPIIILLTNNAAKYTATLLFTGTYLAQTINDVTPTTSVVNTVPVPLILSLIGFLLRKRSRG